MAATITVKRCDLILAYRCAMYRKRQVAQNKSSLLLKILCAHYTIEQQILDTNAVKQQSQAAQMSN
jgi:hypothetical protein